MTFALERPDDQRLVAHLREGNDITEVVGWNPEKAAASLLAAIDGAAAEGYSETYWFEPTGHYWWLLKRDDARLEIAVLWSRSSAVGWQHVFRATDEFDYVADLVRAECARLGL
ncbi:MAG TPA: hypothetical protein VN700_15400 [Vicinamibacterales bacterium]|nr:hypothetical protein [Vicinamibacterales bacterium]